MAQVVGIIFHGIGTPMRDLDPGEAPYWISVERFEAILDQVMALPDPGRIRISFDDGNSSDYSIALPRLLARGLKADFFVLAGRLNQAGSLSSDQVRTLRDAGMGIGSHGVAHLRWSDLSELALWREVTESRDRLEALLDERIVHAAIPFGAWNSRVLRVLRQAGYVKAYSSDRGMMNTSKFLQPRTSINQSMSSATIDTVLTTQLRPLSQFRRTIGLFRKRFSGLKV
jgi:peptidoglycan/xylan/chitin deacetylase (PgdA/CDA1 family)